MFGEITELDGMDTGMDRAQRGMDKAQRGWLWHGEVQDITNPVSAAHLSIN
jgi:hypothetical protein